MPPAEPSPSPTPRRWSTWSLLTVAVLAGSPAWAAAPGLDATRTEALSAWERARAESSSPGARTAALLKLLAVIDASAVAGDPVDDAARAALLKSAFTELYADSPEAYYEFVLQTPDPPDSIRHGSSRYLEILDDEQRNAFMEYVTGIVQRYNEAHGGGSVDTEPASAPAPAAEEAATAGRYPVGTSGATAWFPAAPRDEQMLGDPEPIMTARLNGYTFRATIVHIEGAAARFPGEDSASIAIHLLTHFLEVAQATGIEQVGRYVQLGPPEVRGAGTRVSDFLGQPAVIRVWYRDDTCAIMQILGPDWDYGDAYARSDFLDGVTLAP